MRLFRNNTTTANAIIVELSDAAVFHFGLSSKIIIHYGSDGERHQVRELKAGGGFL